MNVEIYKLQNTADALTNKLRMTICLVIRPNNTRNTDCYLQFCAPRLPQGAVSGRVSAAARVRPACAGLSLGRLALVTPTCLLVATSLLSIYLSIAILSRLHTILGALTLRRHPAVTPLSARTSLEQRSLSPGVTAPLSWSLPISPCTYERDTQA